jgi:hypothetical protein
MEGIRNIVYLADEEVFELEYLSNVISLRRIFEKIEALGEERNLPYKALLEELTKTKKGGERK